MRFYWNIGINILAPIIIIIIIITKINIGIILFGQKL